MRAFPTTDPDSRRLVVFDFTRDLVPGETIVAATITVRLLAGADPAPAELLVGAHQVEGPEVWQLIAGRADGTGYAIKCVATTSHDQALVLNGSIRFREGT